MFWVERYFRLRTFRSCDAQRTPRTRRFVEINRESYPSSNRRITSWFVFSPTDIKIKRFYYVPRTRRFPSIRRIHLYGYDCGYMGESFEAFCCRFENAYISRTENRGNHESVWIVFKSGRRSRYYAGKLNIRRLILALSCRRRGRGKTADDTSRGRSTRRLFRSLFVLRRIGRQHTATSLLILWFVVIYRGRLQTIYAITNTLGNGDFIVNRRRELFLYFYDF